LGEHLQPDKMIVKSSYGN